MVNVNETSRRTVLAGTASGIATAVGARSAVGRRDATDVFAQSAAADDVESFVDAEIDRLLEAHAVPGATVAVVLGDDIVLAKGYGEANRETGTAVSGEETLFRIGSVSKPFVWTAVMQLAETGAVDLETDVTEYLESVSVPSFDDGTDDPITLAHLATHTAGFDEQLRGLFLDSPEAVRPLEVALEETMPERVRPPGDLISYSNHGTALAAQVVADVTGQPFEAYVEERIFEPLGMDRSTFVQPVPDDRADDVAQGYVHSFGTYQPLSIDWIDVAPAGSMVSTAAEMGEFVRAQLGTVDEPAVFPGDARDRLHEQWFTHHEELDGFAFGFIEDTWGDHRLVRHDGATATFHSELVLAPEDDFGVFVSFNGDGGGPARVEFIDAFLEAFLPADESDPLEPEGTPAHAEALEGTYRAVRVDRTTEARPVTTVQAPTVDVTVAADGTLYTETGGQTSEWVELEPLVFRAADGDDRLAFRLEDDDRASHCFQGIQAFERQPPLEQTPIQAVLIAASLLVMLSAVVGWPAHALWERFRPGATGGGRGADPGWRQWPPASGNSALEGRGPLLARLTAGAAVGAVFAFLAGTAALLLFVYPGTLFSMLPLPYRLLFVLPLLGLVATLVTVAFTVLAWRDGYWGRASRFHYTLVTAALLIGYGLLAYWNQLQLPP
ncbi:serine hydrolase domain-containing protein [Natrarchaeobaculum sulfurireducens]|uniref:Beta-lactamase n=1 Tax=Natrarchaeobaculum sulfurireducens TaxID=2044521 RepID=A0A346PMZ9_9EURY|nr:serine hydrolase domain-containing protein [Natrarchaeobaculum sulfurireducens]AXR80894.1 Beta-lactamase [Natrarchaeobaculum sulfurireducens]